MKSAADELIVAQPHALSPDDTCELTLPKSPSLTVTSSVQAHARVCVICTACELRLGPVDARAVSPVTALAFFGGDPNPQ